MGFGERLTLSLFGLYDYLTITLHANGFLKLKKYNANF